MTKFYRGAVGFLLLLVAGCAGGLKVNSDFDPQANFSSYRSYSWLALPRGDDARVNNSLVDGRIRSAVDGELLTKGYQMTGDGNEQFHVGYHIALEGKMDVDAVNTYYGYGYRRWGAWGAYPAGGTTTRVREYTEGTLLVDIVDARTNELVWRGSGTAEVREDVSPEQRQRNINNAVAKILETFPPN